MNKNSEYSNAFLIHISAFAGFIFPFGSIVAPLVMWQTQKDKSEFLDQQGKEAVNFNISYALYMFVIGLFSMPFVFNSFFRHMRHSNFDWDFNFNFFQGDFMGIFGLISLAGLLSFIKIILIIIAALKSKDGENYKYPLTIKFIK